MTHQLGHPITLVNPICQTIHDPNQQIVTSLTDPLVTILPPMQDETTVNNQLLHQHHRATKIGNLQQDPRKIATNNLAEPIRLHLGTRSRQAPLVIPAVVATIGQLGYHNPVLRVQAQHQVQGPQVVDRNQVVALDRAVVILGFDSIVLTFLTRQISVGSFLSFNTVSIINKT
jgi:hypothetical protein